MRLRRPLTLGVTATAATAAFTLAPTPPTPAVADTGTRACSAATHGDFPIDTRIDEGPATYHPGAAPHRFSLDLTNTTATRCADLHPVLVLVDRTKRLTPKRIKLEFRDGTRWRPVDFERTEARENIGVFGEFPGFSVGAGDTVTVDVRLAFTDGTRPDRVTASAALVRRRDDDGDWVGESNGYPFTIEEPTGPTLADELARTGPRALLPLGITAGALLLAGATLVVGARRLRTAGR
ncbi:MULTISPECIES: hypothetical protein [unclassified Streptomyces]|uniref:hypothetical protein n=1 Tax=unclassified Streptomyces TaxID=2593676 RepID=UPI00278BB2F7|nr:MULTISPECIES: hypothetical protein [unclassified Streptomyces]